MKFSDHGSLRSQFLRFTKHILIPDEVFGELTITEATIYGLLQASMNDKYKTSITNTKITQTLGISERTVRRCISSLEAKGFVEVKYYDYGAGTLRVITILK